MRLSCVNADKNTFELDTERSGSKRCNGIKATTDMTLI